MSTQENPDLIATATAFHRVGSVSALRSGQPVGGTVEGKEVAVFAVADGFVATSGICPHAQGPLCEGEVDGHTLTCPWHGWQFSLDSGVCEEDPGLQLERYEVRIDGDDILVRL